MREFPHLQGKMAGYYAEKTIADMDKRLTSAIAQHYLPINADDNIPDKLLGQALALADKIDILTGFFTINDLPTGSKDPFAIRRTAIAIITLLESLQDISVSAGSDDIPFNDSNDFVGKPVYGWIDDYAPFIRIALEQWASDLSLEIDIEKTMLDIANFLNERLFTKMKKDGRRYDIAKAICNNSYYQKNPSTHVGILMASTELLEGFCNTEAGADMLAVIKRVNNSINAEEKKQGHEFNKNSVTDPDWFQLPEERRLYGEITGFDETPESLNAKLESVANMRDRVNAFFENVMINVDDKKIRMNRINLLLELRERFNSIADFSLIQQ